MTIPKGTTLKIYADVPEDGRREKVKRLVAEWLPVVLSDMIVDYMEQDLEFESRSLHEDQYYPEFYSKQTSPMALRKGV